MDLSLLITIGLFCLYFLTEGDLFRELRTSRSDLCSYTKFFGVAMDTKAPPECSGLSKRNCHYFVHCMQARTQGGGQGGYYPPPKFEPK